MIGLLLQMNLAVNASADTVLSPKIAAAQRRQYRHLVEQGYEVNPETMTDPTRKDKRGGIRQSFARNLLRRLDKGDDDTLRFMTEAEVPFTNNLAERDIRMPKLKQKVSGCFRTLAGAQAYCSIRSYLGTSQKRSGNLMEALTALFAERMPAAD